MFMESRKFIKNLTVIRNIPLNSRHFILELEVPGEFPVMMPGQFVQVLVEDSPSTFLRRPFSIHKINTENNTFQLLIQVKGQGTLHLKEIIEGKKLNVIFPLGNAFSLPADPEVLLVGGGCGVAPLLFLAQYLQQHTVFPTILTGWKTERDIFEPEEYEKYGKVPNIVFPTGALVKEGTLHIYYGAADTTCAVASCKLDSLLDDMLETRIKQVRLNRFDGNPIIKPDPKLPWQSRAVFNPTAV